MERENIPEADLLMQAARQLRGRWMTAYAPVGITPHQARALQLVSSAQQMRPSEIAERLRITPRSATEVVDALESAGWVERMPDPGDRRAVLVTLTSEGRRAVRRVRHARERASETYFTGGLTGEERATLAALLGRLVDPVGSSRPSD